MNDRRSIPRLLVIIWLFGAASSAHAGVGKTLDEQLKALSDPDPKIRKQGALALKNRPEDRVIVELEKALDDKDASVRDVVRDTLRTLPGGSIILVLHHMKRTSEGLVAVRVETEKVLAEHQKSGRPIEANSLKVAIAKIVKLKEEPSAIRAEMTFTAERAAKLDPVEKQRLAKMYRARVSETLEQLGQARGALAKVLENVEKTAPDAAKVLTSALQEFERLFQELARPVKKLDK
ncbi:MAG: hypothetical protein U0793_09550 [Gemmataceae bacterium]